MENIMMIVKIMLFFAFIAVAFLLLLFPILLNVYMKEKMGVGVVSCGMTCIEVVCLLGVITQLEDTASAGFTEALGCLAIVVIVSGFLGRKKAKKLGLSKRMTFAVIMAQIISPVSILFIVLMIERLINDIVRRGDKK